MLPPHVLLAAKLMAVFYLVRYWESGGAYAEMQIGLASQTVTLFLLGFGVLSASLAPLAAVLLLLNRGVRVMSLVWGVAVCFMFAAGRDGHADLFLGAFLILAAFQRNGREPLALRYLVVFAYLAWGLAWAAAWAQFGGIPALSAASTVQFDPAALAMMLALFLLGVAFALHRCRPLAIWAGIVFHCAFRDIGPLAGAYTILASYLVFADWPRSPLTVLYDGDCGFCNKTREWISRFDLERLYNWKPYQSGAGAAFGISQEELERRAYVISPRGAESGFQAFRTMALYNPLTYFGLAAVAITLQVTSPSFQNVALVALILAFSPLVRPIGELAYGWVSRNRHRLPPRDCKVPD